MQMHYNPEYPELGEGVAKFRRMVNARGGIKALQHDYKNGGRELLTAYGNAVHAAFVRRTRSIARLVVSEPRVNCASGTALTGENRGEIGRAVAAQHRAKLSAYPAQVRKARTPEQWESMYHAAMAEKRKAERAAEVKRKDERAAEAEQQQKLLSANKSEQRRAKCERVIARFNDLPSTMCENLTAENKRLKAALAATQPSEVLLRKLKREVFDPYSGERVKPDKPEIEF